MRALLEQRHAGRQLIHGDRSAVLPLRCEDGRPTPRSTARPRSRTCPRAWPRPPRCRRRSAPSGSRTTIGIERFVATSRARIRARLFCRLVMVATTYSAEGSEPVEAAAVFVNLVNELPSTTVSADPLAVANRLRPVLLQLARELRREVHPLGVTGGQVSLLVSIRATPGVGVRELAAREGVSPAAMSRHVTRLERAGLVRRQAGRGRRSAPGRPGAHTLKRNACSSSCARGARPGSPHGCERSTTTR